MHLLHVRCRHPPYLHAQPSLFALLTRAALTIRRPWHSHHVHCTTLLLTAATWDGCAGAKYASTNTWAASIAKDAEVQLQCCWACSAKYMRASSHPGSTWAHEGAQHDTPGMIETAHSRNPNNLVHQRDTERVLCLCLCLCWGFAFYFTATNTPGGVALKSVPPGTQGRRSLIDDLGGIVFCSSILRIHYLRKSH